MATGRYTRIDTKRPSSSYCSTVTVVVFVALCLVGVWMMTSSGSDISTPNIDVPQEKQKTEVKQDVVKDNNESPAPQFEDNPGDLPEDATKGDSNVKSPAEEKGNNESSNETQSEEKQEEQSKEVEESKSDETNKSESNEEVKEESSESKKEDGTEGSKTDGDGNDFGEKKESEEGSGESKPESDENEKKSEESPSETQEEKKEEGGIEEKVEQKQENESDDSSKKEDGEAKEQGSQEVFPSAAQLELLNESATQNGSFSTQAAESKSVKEVKTPSSQQEEFTWKLCNTTAGPDYIPCLDNWDAIHHLRSTKHYEHRERHCPTEPPTCLVPLPEGYKRPIEWPKSREKVWYANVPHTKLVKIKGHQNWVKVSGEYLTFPGGGTQFKHGALHYIEFIEQMLPDIAWGKRSRVVLDVGCGVASFGGFLFEKDVLTMSLAPKDEHEAQVQFALERGIPAISAVMGTLRLPFPGIAFDIVHCARCRVPWHAEGGKLLLELNRLLRPGGYFVWSATPIYQKLEADVEIWNAMSKLTEQLCWKLIKKEKDTVNGVGIAIYQKPFSNECYEQRSQNEPPLCEQSDDRNAAWNVPLQSCMHKVPEGETERGSQWPEQWSARLQKLPYWLTSSQVGVYGKSAPEDFTADSEHWKHVVSKSYLNGMGISWSNVRNVMDMRAVYGGFAAALRDLKLWVMNVVTVDSPDTLPIIYERGLFGIYHDWCESFNTYPRSYDLLHADHLFSKINKKCNMRALVVEVDRILRPEGKIIVRDHVEIINELETIFRSMHWEIRMTYSKDKEGLLCAQKTNWRPEEVETLKYALM
ncbi:probable methyltransferase PMT26 [Chenopodium quinoa]|uniref:Methyltransferase PMT26 n=1 Tax=Chenopodium quinoa TaxID=63459 RepID=A0A803KN90_CHEQI|nr:probable methyltransferase PMT26 [Chenopodium quinoa]